MGSTCPCVKAGEGPLRGTSYVGSVEGSTGDCVIFAAKDGSKHCYPLDYGEGECKTWDEFLPPSCKGLPANQAPPEWCQDAWCWVDKIKCVGLEDDEVVPSVFFPRVQRYLFICYLWS